VDTPPQTTQPAGNVGAWSGAHWPTCDGKKEEKEENGKEDYETPKKTPAIYNIDDFLKSYLGKYIQSYSHT
jgi:hypothetical protein